MPMVRSCHTLLGTPGGTLPAGTTNIADTIWTLLQDIGAEVVTL